MRICIVGSGGQGTGIAALLATEEDVEQIVVADQHINAAKRAAARLESLGTKVKVKNIKTEQVDATKREDVARVVKGMDIVFNATLPHCNIPIMQACLDVGAHYLDLLSLPFELPGVSRPETVHAQLELDDRFRAAGLIAIPNTGVSPGWTDLAARYIIDQLETVDTVIIRWGDWFDSRELISCFSPSVMFGEWFGPPYPLCMENGEPKEVDLLESEEEYEFPAPVGRITLHTVTVHPEIVTIPKFIGKPIRHVEEKGGMRIGKFSQKDIWIKAIRKQTAKHSRAEMINMLELFGSSFIGPSDFEEAYNKEIVKDGAVGFSVEVTGTQSGKQVRHTVYNVVTLSESRKHLPWAPWGVYATVGGVPIELILMIGRGEITQRGVIGVAALDNAKLILKRVGDRGHVQTEKIERPIVL